MQHHVGVQGCGVLVLQKVFFNMKSMSYGAVLGAEGERNLIWCGSDLNL